MKYLKLSDNQHFLTVTLFRPEIRNAFDPVMIAELTEVFGKASQNPNLRAVILRGEGKVFCAGADLSWMRAMVDFSFDENQQDALRLFRMFEAISTCAVPVIGVVHGAAFGGALGLIAACDYVIADDKTQFSFSEVKLGIAPAVISAFVSQKAQMGLVAPMMMTGQIFSAQDAMRVGLIHSVVEEESLNDQLLTVQGWIASAAPQAVRATKKILNDSMNMNWEQKRQSTTEWIARLRTGSEGQEGLRSFLDKKTPSWVISPTQMGSST